MEIPHLLWWNAIRFLTECALEIHHFLAHSVKAMSTKRPFQVEKSPTYWGFAMLGTNQTLIWTHGKDRAMLSHFFGYFEPPTNLPRSTFKTCRANLVVVVSPALKSSQSLCKVIPPTNAEFLHFRKSGTFRTMSLDSQYLNCVHFLGFSFTQWLHFRNINSVLIKRHYRTNQGQNTKLSADVTLLKSVVINMERKQQSRRRPDIKRRQNEETFLAFSSHLLSGGSSRARSQ